MQEQCIEVVCTIRKHWGLVASAWTTREDESYLFLVLPLFHLSIRKSAFGTHFGGEGVGLINNSVFLCR